MTLSTIGIAGTGRMGTAMARRLIDAGRTVVVWNRTAERCAEAAEAGARTVPTPAALVAESDVVISSLTDFAALEAVYDGPDGLLGADAAGTLFVETSTILPREQVALEAAAVAAGAAYLECPVGGTVGPALKGQLLGLAGGEPEAWRRARPVLETLCKRVEHLGPVGTGAQAKLAVNLPLAIYWNALGESVCLLAGTGLDGERIASLLADSSAGPNVLRSRPGLVADAIDGEWPPGTFDIDGFVKDLSVALRWAEEAGIELPVARTVLRRYEAASAAGLGASDGACLARFVADAAASC